MSNTEILTVQRAAELLECAESTIEERLLAHELPGVKIGRSWRIPAEAFYERINEMARQHLRPDALQQPAAIARVRQKRSPPPLPYL